jgi:hypothetical protein
MGEQVSGLTQGSVHIRRRFGFSLGSARRWKYEVLFFFSSRGTASSSGRSDRLFGRPRDGQRPRTRQGGDQLGAGDGHFTSGSSALLLKRFDF